MEPNFYFIAEEYQFEVKESAVPDKFKWTMKLVTLVSGVVSSK